MRISHSILSGVALFGAARAAPTSASLSLLPASAPQPSPVYSIGTSGGSNAKPAGRLFNIDGKVEYFAGSNAWWLAHLSNNGDIDKSLAEVANTQYKILRVWGFGDVNTIPSANATDPNRVYFQVLNSTGAYINYGADGLQRLDYAVHSAEKHGVKLILNFVNNWSDYGGIAAYNAAFGGNATTWYTDEQSQEVYKAYIKTLVTRYGNSTAIFAWELGNEPRCNGCPTSTVYNWATEISQYIKSLDPDHMVTLGDEGWLTPEDGYGDGSYAYSGSEGVDFVENLKIETLDYGTFHLYPNSWGYNYSWGNEWIIEHDDVGKKSGKPVILEEYGTPFPHNHTETELPWQQTVLKTSVAADQIWQFGPAGLSLDAGVLGDVNSIYYNDTEYIPLAREHAAAMLAKPPVANN